MRDIAVDVLDRILTDVLLPSDLETRCSPRTLPERPERYVAETAETQLTLAQSSNACKRVMYPADSTCMPGTDSTLF
jgi:hypothetical protein